MNSKETASLRSISSDSVNRSVEREGGAGKLVRRATRPPPLRKVQRSEQRLPHLGP